VWDFVRWCGDAEFDQSVDGGLDDQAVRDSDHGGSCRGGSECRDERVGGACAGLGRGFAAVAADVGSGTLPGVLVRVAVGGLGVGEAGPAAEVDFAEPAVEPDREVASDAEDVCGLAGAAQVGGHDQLWVQGCDGVSGLPSLAPSDVVQGRVGPALEMSGGVPPGPAVA